LLRLSPFFHKELVVSELEAYLHKDGIGSFEGEHAVLSLNRGLSQKLFKDLPPYTSIVWRCKIAILCEVWS